MKQIIVTGARGAPRPAKGKMLRAALFLSTAASLGVAAAPAVAGSGNQQPAQAPISQEVSPLRAEAMQKARELNRLVDGNWDQVQNGGWYRGPLVLGTRGRWVCDLERYRQLFAELNRINDEARAVARGARLAAGSGAPGLVDPRYATHEADLVQNQVALWGRILEECERQNMTISSGQALTPATPSPPVTPQPDAPAAAPATQRPPMRLPQPNLPEPLPEPGSGFAPEGSRADADIRQAFRDANNAVRGCAPALLQLAIQTLERQARAAQGAPPGTPLPDSEYVRALEQLYRIRIPDPCPPLTDLRFGMGVSGGFGRTDLPVGFNAFVDAGGEEVAANFTPSEIDTWSIDAFAGFLVGRLPVSIRFNHTEGDGSSAFTIPPGTRTGFPYGGLSPTGSTGISAFEGLSGTAGVDFASNELNITMKIAGNISGPLGMGHRSRTGGTLRAPNTYDLFAPPRTGFALDGFAGVEQVSTDYRLTAGAAGTTSSGFNFAFDQDRLYEIEELRIAIGLAGRVQVSLAPNLALEAGVEAAVYHRSTDLAFTEVNRVNFGADAPGFTIATEEEDEGVGVRGAVEVNVAFRLSPALELFLGARAQHWTEAGAPTAGIDGDAVLAGERAGLGTSTLSRYGGQLGVRFRF